MGNGDIVWRFYETEWRFQRDLDREPYGMLFSIFAQQASTLKILGVAGENEKKKKTTGEMKTFFFRDLFC